MLECLVSRHDVVADLDSNNPICTYLKMWMDKNSFGSSAMSFETDQQGNGQLSCVFDIYKFRDLFNAIADDMYGTIDASGLEKKLDGDDIVITEERVKELARIIHKKETSNNTN